MYCECGEVWSLSLIKKVVKVRETSYNLTIS